MKKMLLSLAMLSATTVFAQQTQLEKPAYDNVNQEEQFKPAVKIPNQTSFALIDNGKEQTHDLTPKYWLTLSNNNLKSIDPVSMEQPMFRKADYKYGIFLLHNPALKKNPDEFLYPY